MNLRVVTDWCCPNCPHEKRTNTAVQHQVIHRCAGLAGIIAPLVRVGTRCSVEAIEREDYVANDRPTFDDEGRPIMAVRTTRDDGMDCMVLAPVATGGGHGLDRIKDLPSVPGGRSR